MGLFFPLKLIYLIEDIVFSNLLLCLFSTLTKIVWKVLLRYWKNSISYFSDAPERICEKKDKVVNTIKTLLGSDVVALAQNGVRVCGYFFAHLMKNNEELTTELIQPFCRYVQGVSKVFRHLKWAVCGELVHLRFFLRKCLMKKSIMPTLPENLNEIKQTWHKLQPQTWSEVNL